MSAKSVLHTRWEGVHDVGAGRAVANEVVEDELSEGNKLGAVILDFITVGHVEDDSADKPKMRSDESTEDQFNSDRHKIPADVVEDLKSLGVVNKAAKELLGVALDHGVEALERGLGAECVGKQAAVLAELRSIVGHDGRAAPADEVTHEGHEGAIGVVGALAVHDAVGGLDSVDDEKVGSSKVKVDHIAWSNELVWWIIIAHGICIP
jgi:hypothetical protein